MKVPWKWVAAGAMAGAGGAAALAWMCSESVGKDGAVQLEVQHTLVPLPLPPPPPPAPPPPPPPPHADAAADHSPDQDSVPRERSQRRSFRPPKQPACELDGRNRVAVGVCGSVAAVKAPVIVTQLVAQGFYVDVIVTKSAAFFLDVKYRGKYPGQELRELAGRADPEGTPYVTVWCDEDEWSGYTEVGDAVLHIRLADRNLGLLIAPLDANTLAKITVGTADNLLSCVVRAWCWRMEPEFDAQVSAKHGPQAVRRPVVLAPAMNTFMWHQQSTQNALGALRTAGASVIEPVVKTLACGVRGAGALADPTDIVDALVTEMYEWVGAQQAAEAGGLPALVRST